MMKTKNLLLASIIAFPMFSLAAGPARPVAHRRPAQAAPAPATPESDYKRAQDFVRQKDYARASELFFKVSRSAKDPGLKSQSQYFLGLCLSKLGLGQVAAFPLIEAIRLNRAESSKALDILLKISQQLGESSLARYALRKTVLPGAGPETQALYQYMKSEILEDKGDFAGAEQALKASLQIDPKREDSVYGLGLLELKRKNPTAALSYFKDLATRTESLPPQNSKRSMAIMGVARAAYQAHQWTDAAENYRKIAKDSPLYRESLMELSWALFRNGQFRSALSPLQTLHSEFYENFYDPESLLLRSIILLFSCRYAEVDKVLQSFDGTYRVAYTRLQDWLKAGFPPVEVDDKFMKILRSATQMRRGEKVSSEGMPYFLARAIADERDVRVELDYLNDMDKENKLVVHYFGKSPVLGRYAKTILTRRAAASHLRIGQKVTKHLNEKLEELSDFLNREDFIRYENLDGLRESAKKKVASNGKSTMIDQDINRSYYIQNGYRYWPFQGEYWRDEVGNYQFVGKDQCEE